MTRLWIGICGLLPLEFEFNLIYEQRTGNTPLHLAMESGHAQAAVLLIEAGADRDRVSFIIIILFSIPSFIVNQTVI